MEKKEVTISSPVNIAGTTVVTVSTVKIESRYGRRSAVVKGNIQPDSVIVTTPAARRAFRITGEEIALEQLVREFPAISEKLEKI